MFVKLVMFVTLASSAISRHVPRYANLDEDDRLLFRAAYDTPSYEHEEYQIDVKPPINKLDLLKDGMWAMKEKIKEIKTFNKALAANLLSTKLQVKELLENHLKALKEHQHVEIEKNKPVYNYQSPPTPAYPHYERPQYSAPVKPQYESQQYSAPVKPQYESQQYSAPVKPQYESQQYSAPVKPQYESQQYSAPVKPQYESQQYSAPVKPQYESQQYSGAVSQYEPPQYSAPVSQYELPQYSSPVHQYRPPQEAQSYGASQNVPQYDHDPYYGH